MISDFYLAWVEQHKYEDDEGHWWCTDGDTLIDGPYTEEEVDKVLWAAALDGDATPSPP